MKIYYNSNEEHPDFYFMTRKDNGLFNFHLDVPDMDTLLLGPVWIGEKKEEEVFSNAVQISEELNHEFNQINDLRKNYDGISKILKEVFNVDQEVIDRAFDRDPERAELVNDALTGIKDKFFKQHFYFRKLYNKVGHYLNIWNRDKGRTKRYLMEHDIPALWYYDNSLVDVFGECHPTERFLLYEFHDCWGDRLNKIIEEAIKEYPDKDDFDLAYYYTKEKLMDRTYGYE